MFTSWILLAVLFVPPISPISFAAGFTGLFTRGRRAVRAADSAARPAGRLPFRLSYAADEAAEHHTDCVFCCVLLSNSDSIFDFIGNAAAISGNALTNAYFPAALLYNAVSGDLLSLLGFAVLNALPMLLVIALLSKCFLKMTALLKQSHKSAKFTTKHQKSTACSRAANKEFQRFTGSATHTVRWAAARLQ